MKCGHAIDEVGQHDSTAGPEHGMSIQHAADEDNEDV